MEALGSDERKAFVIGLIQKIRATKVPVSVSQSIYHDLGIAGDDAGELLDDIVKKFGTSFREMKFDMYFPNESEAFGYHWARVFGFRDNKRPPLTIDHLLKVIDKGHWFEPQSSSEE